MRLVQGDFDRSREYGADPVAQAREWERQGARAIHVVDLDGAKEGYPAQTGIVREIVRAVGVPVQVGGGVRSVAALEDLLSAGAARVVMGTAAVLDRELRRLAVEVAGESLIVAVDARGGVVSTHGWQSASGVRVLELARELSEDGVAAVLYTDVERDGMGGGAALESTAEVAGVIPTVASGGVGRVEDVSELRRLEGVTGVVVGTALYERRVELTELLEAARP